MSLLIDWNDIALRLVLTVLACGVLGWERGEAHRAAGTRTTLIVGLAASVSMLQANMLLLTIGKTSDSFATADVAYDVALQVADLRCTLKWKAKADNYAMPPALKSISQRPGIQRLAWSL